eukprot:4623984-Amphidinium_carterae.1
MQKEQVTDREATPAEAAATPDTTVDAVVGRLVEEAAQSTAHEDASAVVDPASSSAAASDVLEPQQSVSIAQALQTAPPAVLEQASEPVSSLPAMGAAYFSEHFRHA